MNRKYITPETGRLAKKAGLPQTGDKLKKQFLYPGDTYFFDVFEHCIRLTHSQMHEWIREHKEVCIVVYANASGYIWTLDMVPGGTDLGYCKTAGPNDGGAWDDYNECLEYAMKVILNCSIKRFRSQAGKENWWGNYANYAMKQFNKTFKDGKNRIYKSNET